MSLEAAIQKAAPVATYGGSGTAFIFGLTPSEWQVLGVIGGLLIGLGGLVMQWIFKQRHYKLAEKRASAMEDE